MDGQGREEDGDGYRKRDEGKITVIISEHTVGNHTINDLPTNTHNTCRSVCKYIIMVYMNFSYLD